MTVAVATDTEVEAGRTFRVGASEYVATRRLWSMMGGPEPPPGFASNGCGPKLGGTMIGRLLSWVVPDRVDCWSLLIPCHFHDHAYTVGGGWRDRRAADWNLARNIVTVIAEHGGSMSAIRIFAIGLAYWVAVRLGGWCAWTYRDGVVPASATRRAVTAAVTGPGVAIRLAGHALATSRPIAWVQAALAKINGEQGAIEASYAAKHAVVAEIEAEAARPKPEPPQAPAVITQRARRRQAVIMGVNAYDGRNDLRGCINDAHDMTDTCEGGGVETLTLINRESAGEALLDALMERARQMEPGDELGMSVACHGTTLPDLDDPSGEVAAICPADVMDKSSPEWFAARCITHKEIARVVNAMPPGALFWAWVDACHSGIPAESLAALKRGLIGVHVVDVPYRRARFLPSPFETFPARRGFTPLSGVRDIVRVDGLRSLILSGCRRAETCSDAKIDGRFCGAYTHYGLKVFRANGKASNLDLLGATVGLLAANGYDQVPVAHGDPERLSRLMPWAPR